MLAWMICFLLETQSGFIIGVMEITCLHTFPESLCEEWNTLLEKSITRVPFLRFEYMHDWWITRGGGEWSNAELVLITARENGNLIAVAPLFFTTLTDVPSLLFVGAVEISDFLDFIVSTEKLSAFLNNLFPFLAQLDLPWKQMVLHNLLDDSPSDPILQSAAQKAGWKFQKEALQPCPYISLSDSWETYLAGVDKKQRHEIRRKLRRAEELEVPMRFRIADDPSRLKQDAEDFISLMEQDDDKAKFLTGAMRLQIHQVIQTAYRCGYLNLAFLESGEEKVAAYLNFDFNNRIWVYNSGMNYTYYENSPGWVLLGNMIQWAIDNKREALDFMRGDEEYKYRFGAVDRYVNKITISR
jgi:CelD/BcsL family acetyltransferase involved in cellulose biosynthesis